MSKPRKGTALTILRENLKDIRDSARREEMAALTFFQEQVKEEGPKAKPRKKATKKKRRTTLKVVNGNPKDNPKDKPGFRGSLRGKREKPGNPFD